MAEAANMNDSANGTWRSTGKPRLHDFAAGETGRGPAIPTPMSNNPKPGQWTNRMSHNMIADYKRFLMTDGEGIRCSLYVSGCPFHCVECYNSSIWDFQAGHEYNDKLEAQIMDDLAQSFVRCSLYVSGCPFHCVECYNSSIWDFQAGHEYNDKLEAQIMDDLAQSFVQGITFLGGEPLLNTGVLLPLARKIRERFGHTKDIWCWTGYTWEELMRDGETQDKLDLLHEIDILVDGRYIKTLHDSLLQFRGSRNQRILDVQESFRQGKPVVWAKLHDQERFIPEIYGKERAAGEGDAS